MLFRSPVYFLLESSDPNKKYTGKNITGVNGGPLLVDNEEYIYRIMRKRNMVRTEGVDEEQEQDEAAAGVGDIEDSQ